jgi:hypothetical protein
MPEIIDGNARDSQCAIFAHRRRRENLFVKYVQQHAGKKEVHDEHEH